MRRIIPVKKNDRDFEFGINALYPDQPIDLALIRDIDPEKPDSPE